MIIDSLPQLRNIEAPSVVAFMRDSGCAPCIALKPVLSTLAEHTTVYTIPMNRCSPTLFNAAVDELGVKGTPTVFIYTGEFVRTHARTVDGLLRELHG